MIPWVVSGYQRERFGYTFGFDPHWDSC
jgi:hypothetical protein